MLISSMGCGGSRSAAIEPRYYESRDTESTWLTDTEITQRVGTGTAHGPNGTGDGEHTAADSGKGEDQPMAASKSSSVKERKLVNAGTQCCRPPTLPIHQRRPAQRDEVKNKSKKVCGGAESRPTVSR